MCRIHNAVTVMDCGIGMFDYNAFCSTFQVELFYFKTRAGFFALIFLFDDVTQLFDQSQALMKYSRELRAGRRDDHGE